jgi:hypothetical protein
MLKLREELLAIEEKRPVVRGAHQNLYTMVRLKLLVQNFSVSKIRMALMFSFFNKNNRITKPMGYETKTKKPGDGNG